jgi:hypothetical protein
MIIDSASEQGQEIYNNNEILIKNIVSMDFLSNYLYNTGYNESYELNEYKIFNGYVEYNMIGMFDGDFKENTIHFDYEVDEDGQLIGLVLK